MRFRAAVAGLLWMAANAAAQAPNDPRGAHPGGGAEFDGARFLGAQAGMPGRIVKGAPYSAEVITEITQTLADGNRIHQVSSSRVYRDSEGRTRTEQSASGLGAIAPHANLPALVFVRDPVAGVSYALEPAHRTATRSVWGRPGPRQGQGSPAMAGPGGGQAPRPGERPPHVETLGRQTMEGVTVEGTRTTMIIAAGRVGNEQPIQVLNERWYSPDLQIFVLTRHNDPRSGETVTRLSGLSRGEPPRGLFEVPADFRIRENDNTPR